MIVLNTTTPQTLKVIPREYVAEFTFAYTDVIGNIRSLAIPMEKEFSGNMVIFPSRMKHQVYPFYECDEDRVSIAGNFGVIYE